MSEPEKDEFSGVETTGHEWDGIKELNTPLPRWWLSIFYATIVFSLIYTILFPAWPLLSSATSGVLGYSSRQEVSEAVAAHEATQAPWRDRLEAASLGEIQRDPELLQFALAAGETAYRVNCSQCHGTGAAGGVGFPNLNDDDWLWGGSLEAIHLTISHGVRNEVDPDARWSEMTAFGGLLDPEEITAVAHHVLSLGGLEHDAAQAAAGEELFLDNCGACHGDDGGGDRSQGAPRLSDAIWLYGGDLETVQSQIANPSHGVMPAFAGRLDETTIKALAVFVHSLGGGEASVGETD